MTTGVRCTRMKVWVAASMCVACVCLCRTNASYARWEEARKKFGTITTTSRDIARQVGMSQIHVGTQIYALVHAASGMPGHEEMLQAPDL